MQTNTMHTSSIPSQRFESNSWITEGSGGGGGLKRVYQVWKGNNTFLLGGRFVFGPDASSLVFTILLIVTPVISFCIFDSQQLIHEFNLGNVIVIIPAVFVVYIMVLLLLTSGTDPGIVPRNLHPPEPEDDDYASCLSSELPGNQAGPSRLPPIKDILVNGIIVKVKYCHTCMLYRPPRCSHCSICNNCVERFDHHCPWVGQCIGKRNYRFFFMFVLSTTMLCLYVFIFCWVNIRKIMVTHHITLWKAFGKSPVSGILILYTFITSWFVGGLTVFHIYLICTNQTTYENFRYKYDRKVNTYNLGLVRNVAEIFISKRPKSKNNFRAITKDNSIPIFNSSLSMVRGMSPETPKRSFDVETGGKRKAVVDEELEEIQSQMEIGAGLERCGTQPRHTNLGRNGNWEIGSDMHAMATEFGTDSSLTDRIKINGIL